MVLAVLVAQHIALKSAVHNHTQAMFNIGERDREATAAINGLSEDAGTVSRLMIGTAGGIFTPSGVAQSLPVLAEGLFERWNKSRVRLRPYVDGVTEARAADALATLPPLIARIRVKFRALPNNQGEADRVLLEQMHDEWLDIRVPLERCIRQVRERVEAQSREHVDTARVLAGRLEFIADTILIVGLAAVGASLLILVFGIARPIGHLIDTTRRVTAGDTTVTIPEVARKSEIGDLARAVEALRVGRIENTRLQASTAAETSRAEEMRRARDAEVAANRAKSEFLANMSHELRTPLNAIIGSAEMMARQLMGPAPAVYVEYSDNVHRSGLHLLSIIGDILDMSKIEAGEITLDDEAVNIAEIADACGKLIQGRANERRIALTIDIGADAPAIRADARSRKQVLLNLLANAVKFSEPGGRVTVSAAAAADASFALRVTDQGIGIAEADIEHVFDPFRQSQGGRARGGTGLGLSISRSLMLLHGGSLVLESRLGAGTTAIARFSRERVLNKQTQPILDVA